MFEQPHRSRKARSLLVEPDHPVSQGLTIHATDLGRLLPRGAANSRRA